MADVVCDSKSYLVVETVGCGHVGPSAFMASEDSDAGKEESVRTASELYLDNLEELMIS